MSESNFFSKQFKAFLGLLRYYIFVRSSFRQDFFAKYLPSILTTCIQLYVFGEILGPTLGQSSKFAVPYILFIFPGFLCSVVLNTGFAEGGLESFLLFFNKSRSDISTSPARNYVLVAAIVCSAMIRCFISCFSVFLYTIILSGNIVIKHPFLLFFLILLSSCFISSCGIIQGLNSKTFSEVFGFAPALLLVLSNFSGQIFTLDMIKNNWFLYNFTKLNPLYYLVESFRYAILGASVTDVFFSVSVLIIFTFFALSFAYLETRKQYKK